MEQEQKTDEATPVDVERVSESTAAPESEQKTSPEPTEDNNMVMGILAYLGILVIIPFLVARDNPFVKYHIQQGLVLAVCWIGLMVLSSMIWMFYPIISLVQLGLLVLSIIGIVNVVQKKQVPLPLLGGFAKHFKI